MWPCFEERPTTFDRRDFFLEVLMILTPMPRPPRNNWMEDDPSLAGVLPSTPQHPPEGIMSPDITLSDTGSDINFPTEEVRRTGGAWRDRRASATSPSPNMDSDGAPITSVLSGKSLSSATSKGRGHSPLPKGSPRRPSELMLPPVMSRSFTNRSRSLSRDGTGSQVSRGSQDGTPLWSLRNSLPAIISGRSSASQATTVASTRDPSTIRRSPRGSILSLSPGSFLESARRPGSSHSLASPPTVEPASLSERLSRVVGSKRHSVLSGSSARNSIPRDVLSEATEEDDVDDLSPVNRLNSTKSEMVLSQRTARNSISAMEAPSVKDFRQSPRGSICQNSGLAWGQARTTLSQHSRGAPRLSTDMTMVGFSNGSENNGGGDKSIGFAMVQSAEKSDRKNCHRGAVANPRSTDLQKPGPKVVYGRGSIVSMPQGGQRHTGFQGLMVNALSISTQPRLRWWQVSLHNARKKAAPYCRYLMKTKTFQVTMFLALMSALFLPDLWIVLDRPTNIDLDVFLTVVMVVFVGELVVQSIGLMRTYWGSFFFWMDCIGACSLLVDLSYFPLMDLLQGGAAGQDVSNNVIIMRAARIAKLGARAGRFTKLVKLLRFLPGMSQEAGDQFTAKVISAKLLMALSTRVSCLIIIMVMLMPFFSFWQFPEQDWSMMTWLELLEAAGTKYGQEGFESQLREMVKFYEQLSYWPYHLRVDIPGIETVWNLESRGRSEPPNRPGGVLRIKKGSTLRCDFNFTTPNQVDGLMNMALILLIMILMILFSLQISNSVSGLVLRPLENLLKQVKECAATIFKSVTDMTDSVSEESYSINGSDSSEDEFDGAKGLENETALLEKVVDKLAVLGTLIVQKGVDDDAVLALSESDRGIFDHYTAAGKGNEWKDDDSNKDPEVEIVDNIEMLRAQRAMIQSAGLSLELIDSWNLNPLEIDKARCHAAAMFFLGPQNHGIIIDPITMGEFLRAAESGYNTVPYHSWFHAVDVLHAVYRMLQILCSEAYFSGQERFAILASAVCHDLGHPGLNNPFLIETSHELALRYNDRSPLENMHCARLFEVVSVPRNNIFSDFSDKDYQETRKVCIEAILHTDTKQHFDMIKEVQLLYEVNSEMMVESRHQFDNEPKEFPGKDITNCFRQSDTRALLRKLILHTADISNPTKPFRICRIWAWKCLEEMFMQGDNEKALGVPVQSLNDRDKVNKPFSQVGFIEFLVAPLAFSIVKVLPPFETCVEVLVDNLKRWQDQWVQETQPADNEKKALEERIIKLERRFLDGA